MDVQITRHRETFSAVRTLEGFLACVTAHVKVQVMLVLESFAASQADLSSLLSVAQLMSRQTGDRAE